MRGRRFVHGGEEYAVIELDAHAPAGLEALSPQERAVVLFVLEGLSSAEIARKRRTSPRTVANQLQSAYKKLGVRSRAQLALTLAAKAER
jgi:DNA-binding CsgD family transcriptional regulator